MNEKYDLCSSHVARIESRSVLGHIDSRFVLCSSHIARIQQLQLNRLTCIHFKLNDRGYTRRKRRRIDKKKTRVWIWGEETRREKMIWLHGMKMHDVFSLWEILGWVQEEEKEEWIKNLKKKHYWWMT